VPIPHQAMTRAWVHSLAASLKARSASPGASLSIVGCIGEQHRQGAPDERKVRAPVGRKLGRGVVRRNRVLDDIGRLPEAG
jgi:hypothetical protein